MQMKLHAAGEYGIEIIYNFRYYVITDDYWEATTSAIYY